MKQQAPKGHAKKHAGTKKHQQGAGAKHHPAHQHAHHQPAKKPAAKTAHTVAKHPKHTKPRQLALGAAVACCPAEAVAASARLAGCIVSPADVLALHRRVAGGPDTGATIAATLKAAARYGLAGIRPAGYAPVAELVAGVIGGLMLPGGPHALTLDRGGLWWSWGGLHDFGEHLVLEEAWEVAWP